MALVLCDQRRALLATDGNILVRGGAGSGKTTIALAKACADLSADKLGRDGKALFLSFARATVARVAEQATATIPRDQMARIEISTYHGFAWEILKSHGYLLCRKPGVALLLPAQARGRLAGLDGPAKLARQRELFDQEGLASFDLFPALVSELFEHVPILAKAYARAYPLIIVDEFQDTNAEEWRMISQLGRYSRLIALGDPKQRIYDFKGADPKRFDEFFGVFKPTPFDFKGENNRSAGTQIKDFADDIAAGKRLEPNYVGARVRFFAGASLVPLKKEVLAAVNRYRRAPEWSIAVLVPSNALASQVFDYMNEEAHGLPRYPTDILVSAEGPMLAGNLIALLLEPRPGGDEILARVLDGLAAFYLGRVESASPTAIKNARIYRDLANKIRAKGAGKLGAGVGPGVRALVEAADALAMTGDPVTDWRAVRHLFRTSDRDELQSVGKDARHMRLLRSGAQIEARLSAAWRSHGAYKDARELLAAALVEDQFAATSRPQHGVTVMTIHKSKGKEFDEVIVFESLYHRYLQARTPEAVRSAQFNLHVAATRARRAVLIMTPQSDACPLLQ